MALIATHSGRRCSAPIIREIRETAALVLRYSDGEPGAANVPSELDERRAADAAPADDLDGTEPPAVDGANSAPQENAA